MYPPIHPPTAPTQQEQLLYAQAQYTNQPLPLAGGQPMARHAFSSSSSSSSTGTVVLPPKKKIRCQDVGWSIVGSAFSPDAKWIAYSSWSRHLRLTNTFGQVGKHSTHPPTFLCIHLCNRKKNYCYFHPSTHPPTHLPKSKRHELHEAILVSPHRSCHFCLFSPPFLPTHPPTHLPTARIA